MGTDNGGSIYGSISGQPTIQVNKPYEPRLESFVVELASIEEMPHTVFFFLEMIDMGLWDGTVLLHQESIEHVLGAVPLDYRLQQVKLSHMGALGWKGLAFPEFSSNWQHEKYTLGFANLGPAFYMNTIDNTAAHGPGGQGHHLLPDDADPCFGRVVEGQSVVDELVKFGLSRENTSTHPMFEDIDHSFTQIVSIKLLPTTDKRDNGASPKFDKKKEKKNRQQKTFQKQQRADKKAHLDLRA